MYDFDLDRCIVQDRYDDGYITDEEYELLNEEIDQKEYEYYEEDWD